MLFGRNEKPSEVIIKVRVTQVKALPFSLAISVIARNSRPDLLTYKCFSQQPSYPYCGSREFKYPFLLWSWMDVFA